MPFFPQRDRKKIFSCFFKGNGHERDFAGDERVYIFDMYNAGIYPRDEKAKESIRCRIELNHWTNDQTYLRLLHHHLEKSLNEFQPNFVVYNAGTDILQGDPLGRLDITPQVHFISFLQVEFLLILFCLGNDH